jgi:hypothetical protein
MVRHRFLIAVLLVSCLAGLTACRDDFFDSENEVVVLNDSQCRLIVLIDGRRVFVLEPGSDRSLDDVGPGRHVLEAFANGGQVAQRRTVELSAGEDFYWFLDTCTADR